MKSTEIEKMEKEKRAKMTWILKPVRAEEEYDAVIDGLALTCCTNGVNNDPKPGVK